MGVVPTTTKTGRSHDVNIRVRRKKSARMWRQALNSRLTMIVVWTLSFLSMNIYEYHF